MSEGDISSDEEDLEKSINRRVVNPNVDAVAGTSDGRVTERNKEKEEFINVAVAKFQDMLLNGSFVQVTAQMVQKQLEDNQNRRRGYREKRRLLLRTGTS